MQESSVRPARVRVARSGEQSARRTRRRLTACATGVLTAAIVGVSAQPGYALVTLKVGAANNVYPAMRELGPTLAGLSGANSFTSDPTGQAGGFWRADNSTTLRGITSGNMRKQLQGEGPYAPPGASCSAFGSTCLNGPLASTGGVNGFFSADEDNVKRIIPSGVGSGTCEIEDDTQGLPEVQDCPGANPPKWFVTGKLAVYSCNGSNANNGADPTGIDGYPLGSVNGSGNGIPTSPHCNATPISGPPEDMADVIDFLEDDPENNQISIALPTSAPFGDASKAALMQADTDDGNPATFTYDDSSNSPARNVFLAGEGENQCEGDKVGDLEGAICQVRLEAGITQVRGAVTAGVTRLGLVAVSNVMNIDFTSGSVPDDPGDDPNNWEPLSESAYTAYGPIKQFGVRITSGDTDKNNAMDLMLSNSVIRDSGVQSVFSTYGYGLPSS